MNPDITTNTGWLDWAAALQGTELAHPAKLFPGGVFQACGAQNALLSITAVSLRPGSINRS
jgi:hypothetical protein